MATVFHSIITTPIFNLNLTCTGSLSIDKFSLELGRVKVFCESQFTIIPIKISKNGDFYFESQLRICIVNRPSSNSAVGCSSVAEVRVTELNTTIQGYRVNTGKPGRPIAWFHSYYEWNQAISLPGLPVFTRYPWIVVELNTDWSYWSSEAWTWRILAGHFILNPRSFPTHFGRARHLSVVTHWFRSWPTVQ